MTIDGLGMLLMFYQGYVSALWLVMIALLSVFVMY